MIPSRQRQLSLAAFLLLAGAAAGGASSSSAEPADHLPPTRPAGPGPWVYVGTYTTKRAGRPQSKGIYRMRFDAAGKLGAPELACELSDPSFLALRPDGRFLYAVCEETASVAALSLTPETGALKLLNQQPSGGAGPCYVSLDKAGKTALVANYNSGSIAAFPIGTDGLLGAATSTIQHKGSGPDKNRQAGPHAHCIDFDPTSRFALSCDLGMDKVLVYRFDAAAGTLIANDPPSAAVAPGAGPRHLAFHPSGKFVYVITEMGSTVTVFSWDEQRGALAELQTVSTVAPDFQGLHWAAEIQVHPSGKFLYASDRGDNNIATFAIDPQSGKLATMDHQSVNGKTPRHFAIDPSGKFLIVANQDSDNLVVFGIDEKTGRLTPTGQNVVMGAPVCVLFAP